jgi:hypothetical protein
MRVVFKIVGIAPIAFALVACGGSPKQADDASSQNTAKSDDEGAPKWDSSSTTTTPSSASTSSAATDSSSSSGGDTAASGASPNGSSSSTGTTAAPASNAGPNGEAEIALKRAARQAKANCGAAKDADGKATGPFGKTTVNIVLGRNGHSKNVTLDSSFDGKPAGKCIIQAFTNLTYAPWAGADATTQWEVELVQPK